MKTAGKVLINLGIAYGIHRAINVMKRHTSGFYRKPNGDRVVFGNREGDGTALEVKDLGELSAYLTENYPALMEKMEGELLDEYRLVFRKPKDTKKMKNK